MKTVEDDKKSIFCSLENQPNVNATLINRTPFFQWQKVTYLSVKSHRNKVAALIRVND